jgi:rhodanese-related sulfurtransferase
MDDYKRLVNQALEVVGEVFPWDIEDNLDDYLLLDIREAYEFDFMHIKNSINVPRGILEGACCWNYNDTVPELAGGRDKDIVIICKSGNRSALASKTMMDMGFKSVKSLKLGIRGWNDNDLETIDNNGNVVDLDIADEWLNEPISDTQKQPE